jgi:DNA-directed RNA polymerase specialized sigma24 family protein
MSDGPATPPPTDELLGARARDGDRAALEELFARHEDGLYNVTLRAGGSREDAADITREAFARMFARLAELQDRGIAMGTYLHRTARSLADERAGGAPEGGHDGHAPGAAAPEEDVPAANARLPQRQRLVLALRELEGMGYADIGRVLGLVEGAVAQLLARARLGLRRELGLQQVDVDRMDAACRARLGYIGGLIDGELAAERAHDLLQHVSGCPTCGASRAAFVDARARYRRWLPVSVAGLGLGAEAARAAYAGGGAGAGSREPEALDDLDALAPDPEPVPVPIVPPVRGGRILLAVGGATLLLLLVGGATLVGMRSGSGPEATPVAAPNVAEAPAATLAVPSPPRPRTQGATTAGTTTGTTTDPAEAPEAPSARAPARPSRTAAPVTTIVSGVVRITPAPTTRRTATTAPGGVAAPGGGAAAGDPSPPDGGAAQPTTGRTDDPEPPRTTQPTTTEAPPTTEEPPTTAEPPTTDVPTTPPGTTPGT